MMNGMKGKLLGIGSVVILAILPVFFHANSYIMRILILCLMWSVVAQSWDLIVGYADVFAFAHLAFFAVGGYTSGILASYLGISPWLGALAGAILAALIGVLIGIPCLRLQGFYMAMVTFPIQFILPVVIVWAGPGRFENFSTGGSFGLQAIPQP